MKVSVLVPVYNVEKQIERCMVSLMEQTMSDMEFIFVDDCSPDSSVEVIRDVAERYPSRRQNIRVIKHEVNRGLECARRSALAVASGEYVIFVDSDDYVEHDLAEQMYAQAEAEKAEIVISDMVIEKPDGTSEEHHDYLSDNPQDWFRDMLDTDKTLGFLWSKMYNRDFIVRHIPDEEPRISYLEDLSVNVRLFYYARRITHVHRAFYHYVYNNQSITKHQSYYERKFRDSEIYFQRIENFLRHNGLMDKYGELLDYKKIKMKVHLLFDADIKTRVLFVSQYYDVDIIRFRNRLKLAEYVMLWATGVRQHWIGSLLIALLRLKGRLAQCLH